MANNSTNATDADFEHFFRIFETVSISSAIFLTIVAVGTIITNGFALFTIAKDPLKCFRNPQTIFITGILISDFLTGLVVEPVFVSLYSLWMNDVDLDDYMSVLRSSQILCAVTINTSFLTVLALAVAQLLALRWPSIYNRFVTQRLSIIVIIGIWIYAVLFALLPEIVGITLDLYFTIDLILHTTLISVELFVIYIFIYFAFKRAMHRYEITAQAQSESENAPDIKTDKVEKDFIIGTFIIILVLIVTIWPFTITLYILVFGPQNNIDHFIKVYIALVVFDDILFLKFLLDPLIFVWRIPKYRTAMSMVLAEIRQKLCSGTPSGTTAINAAYHRQEAEDSGEQQLIPEWSADLDNSMHDTHNADVATA